MIGTSAAAAPYREVRRTKIPARVFPSYLDADRYVAGVIAELIRKKARAGENAVLGLATGSTPMGVYRELIRLHREEGLDFSNVVTFNLDEYYPMAPDRPQSFRRWMDEYLFDHIRINKETQTFVPDGTVLPESMEAYCARYEERIRQAGGIDLQLLGIGRTGHIGFNEPGSTVDSRTRLVTLDPVTRRDAASDFFGECNVPLQAITMGVGSILTARRIVMMAFGEHKASIVRQAAQGPITEEIAASFLQMHSQAELVLDPAAASKLTDFETPWLLGPVDWNAALKKRAMIWLCLKLKKALLRLEDDDLRAHGLHELLREHGPAQKLAQEVFQELLSVICFVPGGSERHKVIVFSPHPDDDVISMGGTLLHLIQAGHDVHVAYMTSGNIAVFDHDALRFVDFVGRFNESFGVDDPKSERLRRELTRLLTEKRPGDFDHRTVLDVKALIRETEARAAVTSLGVRDTNLHFLRLPFYETGQIKKRPISEDDVRIVHELLCRVGSEEIYVAGDLSDPHGTHRVCADAIFRAVCRLPRETRPVLWLYRGAWQEWEPHEIDRAVPLSPHDIEMKRQAIFRHESQKDEAMFPGPYDTREFWERAEQRNRHTADLFNQLGLPEYYAMEGFVRGNPETPL